MASAIKLGCAAIVLMFISNLQQCVIGAPQVPCYFIFGDSLADDGNNNALPALAKANYPPYGIDFPKGPTGRFTNGETVFDIITKLLGFDNYIPPFAIAGASDFLKGLNYASGAAGILSETGRTQGARISLYEQIVNHELTVKRISAKLGSVDSATRYLNKCLYTVGIGNNDYLNNYFLPQYYGTSRLYNPSQYARVLVREYAKQLRILLDNGATKIALFGLGSIGCIPYATTSFPVNSNTGCVENFNHAAQLFNDNLKSLVDELNTNSTDAKFIYVNVSGITPNVSGFTVFNSGCCQVINTTGLCIPFRTPCKNRSEYVFWDSFHPTQAWNQKIAPRTYNASEPSDAYPYDISHLVQS
ncbi:GDSL esterase/lipase At4g18970-like [Pistacia vera]|uniref:GDSL esterase/lipase At4g18970-like n=1 Tax=Pistacia vera TaxID=55513 RepID=UPI001262C56B|nr:GDSL esterase/lipase At4g18970-like [Pistacia vera]